MPAFRGAIEVGLAVIGAKEGPNREVGVEGHECTGGAIESTECSAHLFGLNHVLRQRGVAQILCHRQIARLRDVSELLPVLEKVLPKLCW